MIDLLSILWLSSSILKIFFVCEVVRIQFRRELHKFITCIDYN